MPKKNLLIILDYLVKIFKIHISGIAYCLRSDGRCTVGVAPTPTVPQALCTSAFQPLDGRRVGLFEKELSEA